MKHSRLLLFIALIFSSLQVIAQEKSPNDKLKEMGIKLPTPGKPVANYVNYVRTGNLIFLAGKGPKKPDGKNVTGKLGQELTVKQGYEAAKLVAIQQIAVLNEALGGDLSKVKRVVKVLGMVNATPDFIRHPEVINGFSDMMVRSLW